MIPIGAAPGPRPQADRIVLLDALRGMLLYFILIANLPSFTGFWFLSPEQREALMTPLDAGLLFLVEVFLHGKFYTLFSLLFGVGFAVILSRMQRSGVVDISAYRRRLLALAAIGLVHMLLWPGDILLPYALCGLLLVFFRNASDSFLLRSAVLFIFLPVAFYALAMATDGRSDPAFHLHAFLKGVVIPAIGVEGGPLAALQSGDPVELLRANLVGFGYRWVGLLFEGRLFKVLGVFLIGLWLGRRLVAGGVLGDTLLLKRILIVGGLVGLPANVGLAYLLAAEVDFPLSRAGLLQYVLYAIGVVPLAMAYAAAFVLLWRHAGVQRALSAFAPMGRMALSNYIMQTLVAIAFFYGIVGQSRMGESAPSDWLVFATILVAAQMVASAGWLRYFRYGPLEWLWRGATYGFAGLPPILKSRSVGVRYDT